MIRAAHYIRQYVAIFLYVGVLATFGSYRCQAQQLPLHLYTIQDGLISNYITCLYQDSRHYLWIGTMEGVSVFDGLTFRNYTPADGIPFPYIATMVEDKRSPGTMWIGTNGRGLCKITGEKIENPFINTPLANIQVFSLEQDHNGTLWCGTGENIFLIKNDSIIQFHPEIQFGAVQSIVESPDGDIWIGCNKGLFLFDPRNNSFRQMMHDVVWTVALDEEKNIWVGTHTGDVIKIHKEQIVERRTISTTPIGFLFSDRKGSIWGTSYQGVFKIDFRDSASWDITHYSSKNGFINDNVTIGLADNKGNLWFGGTNKGIFRLMGKDIYRYQSDSLMQRYNNGTAVPDSHGHLWVAAYNVLWEVWNTAEYGWHRIIHAIPQTIKDFMITIDGKDRLWLASTSGQIQCYEIARNDNAPSKLSISKKLSLKPYTALLCFIVDKDNLLWCSTVNDGVIVFDPAKENPFVRRIDERDGLPGNSVRTIFQDREGSIWFGGYSQGIGVLAYKERLTGKVRAIVPKDKLLDNGIRAFAQDDAGKVWVGSRYGGLATIENDSIVSYTVKEGLLSNGVWTIGLDRSHRMLIGTQLGLQDCNITGTARFSRNADFTGSTVYACGVLESDYGWFVSSEGLTLYKRTEDVTDTTAPLVYISNFQVNGKGENVSPDMRFAHDQNNFVIDFLGVDLKDARALRYEYRMLSADEDWHSPTTMHEVTYAALKPGSYRFEVRAIGSNNSASASTIVAFTITPPYWQRWWFILGAVCVLTVVVVLVVRERVRRLLEIERIRSRIATDLHDDIGSGLTRIAIFSDVASRQISALNGTSMVDANDPVVAASSIRKVGNIARELVDAMSDVVWSIDPKQDSMHELLFRLRTFAFEICEAKNISLSFELGKGVDQIKLSSEVKRGILLLVKEALTNVVRHSGCSTVRIVIELEKQFVTIHVIDDGKGFDASAASFGNGLTNMRKRVEKSGGKFSIISSPGSGTRINVAIPIAEKTAHLFS